jgi:hypothetical protein
MSVLDGMMSTHLTTDMSRSTSHYAHTLCAYGLRRGRAGIARENLVGSALPSHDGRVSHQRTRTQSEDQSVCALHSPRRSPYRGVVGLPSRPVARCAFRCADHPTRYPFIWKDVAVTALSLRYVGESLSHVRSVPKTDRTEVLPAILSTIGAKPDCEAYNSASIGNPAVT